jgi:hypothetical protein
MDSNNAPMRVKSGGTLISRRTVTRGVAWSAPIAAIGVAAPAFAASQPVVVTLCGTTCKHPGNSSGGGDLPGTVKIYHFTFCFTSSQPLVGGTVTITAMTINGVRKTGAANITPITVDVSGTQKCYYIDGLNYPDSANGTGLLEFSYRVVGDSVDTTGSIPITFNGIDRCGTGSDNFQNPKDFGHPAGSTAVPPPGNVGCV